MKPERMTAFTDGVIAIIITIMVLALPVPKGHGLSALESLLPILGVYALSFANIAIFWVNHHHMVQRARRVDGQVLWANNFLLFWLSLVPFVIRWIGEEGFQRVPIAAYGMTLTMAALGYTWLEYALINADGEESRVKAAVGTDIKGHASLLLYVVSILAALFISPMVAVAIYILIALLWFIPDQRYERVE